jgi:hypothetical protein
MQLMNRIWASIYLIRDKIKMAENFLLLISYLPLANTLDQIEPEKFN